MKPENYREVYQDGVGELVEKKSRFVATVRRVTSEEEAAAFIEEMKKKYWDASHNCSAFVLGMQSEISRCSDDGEPSGTAGRPMLEVLLGEEIRNVAVVVTRYFGGTLLGTGGLVRAYGRSVKEGLAQCVIVEKRLAERFAIETDYNGIGKLQYIIGKNGYSVVSTEYTDQVVLDVLIPAAEAGRARTEFTEATNGQVKINEQDPIYYTVIDNQVQLFP